MMQRRLNSNTPPFGHGQSVESLEAELEKPDVPRLPLASPSKAIVVQPEHSLGVSPPGPRSIWKSPPESLSDSSSPRRFIGSDESPEIIGAVEEDRAKLHIDPNSPFHNISGDHLLLEELDDGYMEQYPLYEPVAAPSRPAVAAPANEEIEGSPPANLVDLVPPHLKDAREPIGEDAIAPNGEAVEAPKRVLDLKTQKIILLFNAIKAYCKDADIKRTVNLMGKTAEIVETQARSLWSYLGWSSAPATKESNKENAPAPIDGVPVPPPDSDTTLTLLVVRTNWYGRDQYRFLRLEPTAFVRLRVTNEFCERTLYEHVIAVQVSNSIIKIRYKNAEVESEITYNFGDPTLARMIADSLALLKDKGSVAISFVGN